MLYMNGDNNLTHEVLYSLDMIETVGSSDDINILALVDGRPGVDHGYGNNWDGTKLLYITRDTRIGEINSLIEQYTRDVRLKDIHGHPYTCRYSASMAIIRGN